MPVAEVKSLKLALKVDVDTHRGYVEGVPGMLDLFGRLGVRATFFFSFGPDNSGKAIRRIFRRGFLRKMFRTRAPSTYGLKTLLYGTLLPAPMIVDSAPDVFRRALGDGHECGVHAWDHVLVQDKLDEMDSKRFESLYGMAADKFAELSGRAPDCYAAPGWQVSPASLSVLERLNLRYASDARGTHPFFPVLGGRAFSILQIPTTLPTMDEILGGNGVTDENLPGIWISKALNSDLEWNVLTVHAEMEGMSKLPVFEKFLNMARDRGFGFTALGDIARGLDISEVPHHEIAAREIPGRAGTVAVQGRKLNSARS